MYHGVRIHGYIGLLMPACVSPLSFFTGAILREWANRMQVTLEAPWMKDCILDYLNAWRQGLPLSTRSEILFNIDPSYSFLSQACQCSLVWGSWQVVSCSNSLIWAWDLTSPRRWAIRLGIDSYYTCNRHCVSTLRAYAWTFILQCRLFTLNHESLNAQ